jgi:uncharacterized membrane protein
MSDSLFKIILYVHIICGAFALVAGTMAMIGQKGQKLHGNSGRCFFWSITGVFLSSLYLSIVKENVFLFFVGFFSFYLAATGYRSLTIFKTGKVEMVDYIISLFGMSSGLGLLVYSFMTLAKGSFAIVPIFFGLIALSLASVDFKNIRKGFDKTKRFNSHGIRMAGAYVAVITAFIVVNIQIKNQWMLWVLPTFIIIPIAVKQIRNFTKKA